jgi:putative copper resistance protein D
VLTLAVVRAVHFAFAVQAIGALLFVFILGGGPAGEAVASARRCLMRTAMLSAAAVLPTGFAWLALQAADMTGRTVGQAWDDGAFALLLFKTHAGVVWWVRLTIAGLLLIELCGLAFRRRAPSKAALAFGLLLAVASFVSCAWLGHAGSDAGAYASLHLAAHGLHMFGAALWLGGFLPLSMLLLRAARSDDAAAAAAARAASQSFGNIALVAVGVIIVSGAVTVSLVMRDMADLTTGLFAEFLAVKLVLFCLMLALAATNRLHLVPRLATSNDALAMTRLWWSVLGELLLGLLVLFVVGALGITPTGDDE